MILVFLASPKPSAQPERAPEPAPAPEQHGQRGGRLGEVVAYVDGAPVAVVRWSELPASMTPIAIPALDGLTRARYFRLYDYVRALGVDVAKVRAVQLHGARGRVATVDGAELARFRDTLVFDFSQEVRGKPRARWSIRGLAEPTQIDQFTALAIYVDKPAPRFDPRVGALLLEGVRVDGVPYTNGDRPSGTRVYLDGKLVGWVKRKNLGEDLVLDRSTPGKTAYDLPAFLARLGVDRRALKTIDVLEDDELAARLNEVPAAFWLVERSQGKARIDLPSRAATTVTSLQLFARADPRARAVQPSSVEEEEAW
jgi:hypothetical protein